MRIVTAASGQALADRAPVCPPPPASLSFAAILWFLDDGNPTSLSNSSASAPPFLTMNRSPTNIQNEGYWSAGYSYWEYAGSQKFYTSNAFGTRGGCWPMITRKATLHRVGSRALSLLAAGLAAEYSMANSASAVVKSAATIKWYWNDLEIASTPNQLSVAVGK